MAGCDTSELILSPGYRRVWAASVSEARAVFHAMGIYHQRLPGNADRFLVNNLENILRLPQFLVQIITHLKQTKNGKTSMLQDLENKVEETEVDFITGRISSLGREFNVPTPVNDKLVELVKEATLKKQGSPKLLPQQLVEACGLPASPNSSVCQIM